MLHNVGQCYRCGTTVEPITSKQWFVKMKLLAEEAIRVVKDGTIQFVPERFSKIYLNWMENVHAAYPGNYGGAIVFLPSIVKNVEKQLFKGRYKPMYKMRRKVNQDPDVLDTWFSSALWPFSTLGLAGSNGGFEIFLSYQRTGYGYDIIFSG